MANLKESFTLPFNNPLIKDGSIAHIWLTFFREIYSRLFPLGREQSFSLTQNGQTFGTSDVDTGTDEITISGHGYSTGDSGFFYTTGALPGGILANFRLYIIRVDDDTIKVASTLANANAGSAVNITNVGVGTHCFSKLQQVTGLTFDKNYVSHGIVECVVQRVINSVEYIECIIFNCNYLPYSEDWYKQNIDTGAQWTSGVDFAINSDGSVHYGISVLSGTQTYSRMFYRTRTLAGKAQSYSRAREA